eukprot:10023075-Karenia_brevis.AAC.1
MFSFPGVGAPPKLCPNLEPDTMGPNMSITCRLCGSGSMVPEKRICQWCDSMLCPPCVDLHTYQVAARGMTYCQLWSHENNRPMHSGVVMNADQRNLLQCGHLSVGEGRAVPTDIAPMNADRCDELQRGQHILCEGQPAAADIAALYADQ